MTTQEAYEKMVAHFSKPGAELAKDDKGNCFYRRYDGDVDRRYSPVQCAVGCLVPSALYDDSFEDSGLTSEMQEAFGLANVGSDFLHAAQADHDSISTHTAADFVARLHRLAAVYDLDVIA